jgi:hypothetical protein
MRSMRNVRMNTNSSQCLDVRLDGGTLLPGNLPDRHLGLRDPLPCREPQLRYSGGGFTGLGKLAQGEDLQYAFDVILTSTFPEPAAGPVLAGAGMVLYLFNQRKKGKP